MMDPGLRRDDIECGVGVVLSLLPWNTTLSVDTLPLEGGDQGWGSFPSHQLIHLLPTPLNYPILPPITPDERAALQRPVAGVMPSRERRCSFGFELRP
jgi:hypothetical protein